MIGNKCLCVGLLLTLVVGGGCAQREVFSLWRAAPAAAPSPAPASGLAERATAAGARTEARAEEALNDAGAPAGFLAAVRAHRFAEALRIYRRAGKPKLSVKAINEVLWETLVVLHEFEEKEFVKDEDGMWVDTELVALLLDPNPDEDWKTERKSEEWRRYRERFLAQRARWEKLLDRLVAETGREVERVVPPLVELVVTCCPFIYKKRLFLRDIIEFPPSLMCPFLYKERYYGYGLRDSVTHIDFLPDKIPPGTDRGAMLAWVLMTTRIPCTKRLGPIESPLMPSAGPYIYVEDLLKDIYAKLGLPRQAKLISEEAVWCPMPGRRSLAIDPGRYTVIDDDEEKPPHPIVYDLESGKELGTVPTPVPRQNVRIRCVQDRLFVQGSGFKTKDFYVEYVWTGEGFRLVRDLLK